MRKTSPVSRERNEPLCINSKIHIVHQNNIRRLPGHNSDLVLLENTLDEKRVGERELYYEGPLTVGAGGAR
jgi:hypothetical protein